MHGLLESLASQRAFHRLTEETPATAGLYIGVAVSDRAKAEGSSIDSS
jgi:hypothetical protein